MPGQAQRKRYETDLTDEEWALIAPLLPLKQEGPGRRRTVNLREVVNALRYKVRTGCQWRYLPHDFPPSGTVQYYYDCWMASAAIIDSQSVKSTEVGGERGFDGGKKVRGRKRQLLVDTQGFLLKVLVHAADISDKEGGKRLLLLALTLFKEVQHLWADQAYAGLREWLLAEYNASMEIPKHDHKPDGFEVLPRRWVVERSIAWLSRFRGLSKDYEYLTTSSETMIYLASTCLLLKQLAKHH